MATGFAENVLFTTGIVESLRRQCEEIAKLPSNNVQQMANLIQRMIVAYYSDIQR
jgi:hypothetical protein